MTLDPAAMAVITALASSLVTLAGLVYRELRQQIADRDTRIAAYEAAAAEALKAKDAEIAEWKRRLDGLLPTGTTK